VLCYITDTGQALLTRLDPLIDAADLATMAMLEPAVRRQLIEILARIRVGVPTDG
jgi:hypothetical protein